MQKDKKRLKRAVTITCCFLLAAGLCTGGYIWNQARHPIQHMSTAIQTQHYKLSTAELSFYAWQAYQIDKNSGAAKLPKDDRPLSIQDYDSTATWKEHYIQAGIDNASNILKYCEAAAQAGYTPEIDLHEQAMQSLETLEEGELPPCVTQEDAARAMELLYLGQAYAAYTAQSLTFSGEELEAYAQAHPKEVAAVDYIYFPIAFSQTDELKNDRSTAEALAKELRKCNTEEKFRAWVVDYTSGYTDLSAEEVNTHLDALVFRNALYTEGDEFSEWAFTDSRKAGDTTVIEDSANGCLNVFLLLSAPARDETHPVTLRQIAFPVENYDSEEAARSEMESLLSEWEEIGATEEQFASLAESYSDDTAAGGLYTNIMPGQLVPSWRDWLFDAERKPGDTTILSNTEDVCAVYFVERSDNTDWEVIANDALSREKGTAIEQDIAKNANVKVHKFWTQFAQTDHQ